MTIPKGASKTPNFRRKSSIQHEFSNSSHPANRIIVFLMESWLGNLVLSPLSSPSLQLFCIPDHNAGVGLQCRALPQKTHAEGRELWFRHLLENRVFCLSQKTKYLSFWAHTCIAIQQSDTYISCYLQNQFSPFYFIKFTPTFYWRGSLQKWFSLSGWYSGQAWKDEMYGSAYMYSVNIF